MVGKMVYKDKLKIDSLSLSVYILYDGAYYHLLWCHRLNICPQVTSIIQTHFLSPQVNVLKSGPKTLFISSSVYVFFFMLLSFCSLGSVFVFADLWESQSLPKKSRMRRGVSKPIAREKKKKPTLVSNILLLSSIYSHSFAWLASRGFENFSDKYKTILGVVFSGRFWWMKRESW